MIFNLDYLVSSFPVETPVNWNVLIDWLLGSAKLGHIEPSSWSAAKKSDDCYQAMGALVVFRLDCVCKLPFLLFFAPPCRYSKNLTLSQAVAVVKKQVEKHKKSQI